MAVRQTMIQGYESGSTLTVIQWDKTLADFNGLCAYCQERPYKQLEHFIPRTKGGKTHVGNCLPACVKCNKRKNNLIGKPFIALIGQDKFNYLKQYLEMRSNQPIEVKDTPIPKHDPGVRLRIKEIAQSKGMKQYDLSQKSGVTLQVIGRYWNNHTQSVNLDMLGMIADTLDVQINDLIEHIK